MQAYKDKKQQLALRKEVFTISRFFLFVEVDLHSAQIFIETNQSDARFGASVRERK